MNFSFSDQALIIWNQLPVSKNLSLFKNLFFSLIALIALICDWCVYVCVCVFVYVCVCACASVCESLCVRACVRASMLYALNFDKYIFVENV